MTTRSLAVIFSAWVAFAATANAQLAESDSASERDNRAAAPDTCDAGYQPGSAASGQ